MFNQFPSKVDPRKGYRYLNGHQFKAETDKCLQCAQKPCNKGCPCNVDPSTFILAASNGEASDIDYAALTIYSMQPLGSVCGIICPVSHCMAKCSRSRLDASINIPGLQAEIMKKAAKNGNIAKFVKKVPKTGKKVAVVGAGPSGLSASACLAARGHSVVVFEKNDVVGGDLNFIPKSRFPAEAIQNDVAFIKSLGDIEIKLNTAFEESMEKDFDAVIYAIGEQIETKLGVQGEEHTMTAKQFLKINPEEIKGKSVCILGCGGVAVDCAILSQMNAADKITIIYRRKLSQARLEPEERGAMSALGITVVERMGVKEFIKKNNKIAVKAVQLDGELNEIEDSEIKFVGFDFVVEALGQKSTIPLVKESNNIFICGQARGKNASAVQASASGKNAAMKCDALLNGKPIPEVADEFVSKYQVFEQITRPADISTTFDSFKVDSPFIASASPFTETLHACKKTLDNGFGGVIIGVGNTKGYKPAYRVNHESDYLPNLQLEEAIKLINDVKNEHKSSIVGAYIQSSHDDLKAAVTKLSTIASFVQVDASSPDEINGVKEAISGVKNVFVTINGACNLCTVAFGAKTYKEGMAKIAAGAKLVVVDLSLLRRCSNNAEALNRGLSMSIAEKGFSSLDAWAAQSKGFDIEDISEEKLINYLTNPYVCIGCGRCTECPNDAIDLQPSKWIYKVDPDKCEGCGLCAERCPTGACSLITRAKAIELKSKEKHW